MQNFSTSPFEMASSFFRHRELIMVLIKREVLGRYRGSAIGVLWAFLNPIIMMVMYTFVFSIIFKVRWIGNSDSNTAFALILFAGLIVFNLFAECFNRSPGLILANQNYVKKVIFPLEILPWVVIGSALFHALVSLAVWILTYIVLFGVPHLTIFFLPLVLLPFILFIAGIIWGFSALGVYFRDISQFINMFTSLLMFISPIFYPLSSIPEQYRYLFELNPITPTIEKIRSVLFFGIAPDFLSLLTNIFFGTLVAYLGFYFFQKSRKGFADVL